MLLAINMLKINFCSDTKFHDKKYLLSKNSNNTGFRHWGLKHTSLVILRQRRPLWCGLVIFVCNTIIKPSLVGTIQFCYPRSMRSY